MAQELTKKKIFIVFVPAILLGALGLFIQIIRYEPLLPTVDKTATDTSKQPAFTIPILPTDPIIGSKKSPITVIAFEDFSCDACKAQHDLFLQIQKIYPDKVKMIWKGLPVHDFPYPSVDALRYSVCATEQNKFDDFASYAFSNGDNLSESTLVKIGEEIGLDAKDLTACLASDRPTKAIELTKNIANTLNLQSVPTFFINNAQIKTPESLDEWRTTLGL